MKPALSGRPDTKVIIFPTWRDERKHIVEFSELLGAVLFWAVRQSPYAHPDDLQGAAEQLAAAFDRELEWNENHKNFKYVKLSCYEIRTTLEAVFEKCPAVMAWNEPKSKHGHSFVCTSRYGGPDPDDDIIGLGALARNASHTIVLERLYEEDPDDVVQDAS